MRYRTGLVATLIVTSLGACSAERADTEVPRFLANERAGSIDPAADAATDATTDADASPGGSSPLLSGDDPDSPDGIDGTDGPTATLEGPSVLDIGRLPSPALVVDQFGYLPEARKIAVLRDPRSGADAGAGATLEIASDNVYLLVDDATDEAIARLEPRAWNGGATDASSGDRVWWLDFSGTTDEGRYRIESEDGGTASPAFRIADDVYDELLVQALRTFYYQRAGFAKRPPYADARWADGASHLGSGQDTEARRHDSPDDAASERDLSGGWYDAGDYNRYTLWSADYVIDLLHAWEENPAVWGDDFGLPDSGNGLPDLVDEILWGLDWLERMQESDGSLLSVLDVDEASPPSSARGPSRYGAPSTAATLGGAAAYAYAASSFADSGIPTLEDASGRLLARAERAWAWAEANPDTVFRNNDPSAGTEGIGAGQQEPDERGRERWRLSAAIYLAEATGDERYRGHVSANLPATLLIGSRYASPFHASVQRDILFHADHETRDLFERERIRTAWVEATSDQRFWSAEGGRRDAYLSYLDEYVWGSNGFRAKKGSMYLQLIRYGLGERDAASTRQSALDHLNYLHGVNPLGLVYLSNMAEFGAERSVDTLYHRWFTDDSPLWDTPSRSRHGPLPGFLVGGPNPTYRPAECCPDRCGLAEENARCEVALRPPFTGQPTQKSFVPFNEGFPMNSWQMTENSNGYQIAYLRLLAWFVSAAER